VSNYQIAGVEVAEQCDCMNAVIVSCVDGAIARSTG